MVKSLSMRLLITYIFDMNDIYIVLINFLLKISFATNMFSQLATCLLILFAVALSLFLQHSKAEMEMNL